MGNSIKCLFRLSDALLHRESNQGFTTFRLLARRFYLVKSTIERTLNIGLYLLKILMTISCRKL